MVIDNSYNLWIVHGFSTENNRNTDCIYSITNLVLKKKGHTPNVTLYPGAYRWKFLTPQHRSEVKDSAYSKFIQSGTLPQARSGTYTCAYFLALSSESIKISA